jgi:hypothetical protein
VIIIYLFALITDLKSVLRYHQNFPWNRDILSRQRLRSAGLWTRPGRKPEKKSLFIHQYYDTFGVLGRRKQHILPDVSFLLTFFLGKGCRSAVVSVSVFMCRTFYCENLFPLWLLKLWTKVRCVNLHVVQLHFNKNNNIRIFCWFVVFAMSRKCINSPNLSSFVCGEFTAKPQTKSITPIVKKECELYFGCKIGDQGKS